MDPGSVTGPTMQSNKTVIPYFIVSPEDINRTRVWNTVLSNNWQLDDIQSISL